MFEKFVLILESFGLRFLGPATRFCTPPVRWLCEWTGKTSGFYGLMLFTVASGLMIYNSFIAGSLYDRLFAAFSVPVWMLVTCLIAWALDAMLTDLQQRGETPFPADLLDKLLQVHSALTAVMLFVLCAALVSTEWLRVVEYATWLLGFTVTWTLIIPPPKSKLKQKLEDLTPQPASVAPSPF